MTNYTAITFAPVQGFIEKSRKLRDLYGASLILSYLSKEIVQEADKTTEVISPAIINIDKGMPNRILLKGDFYYEQAKSTILSAWKQVLQECRTWIERKLPQYEYHWEREWRNWGNYAWEIFWGEGESIKAAMDELEKHKLSRDWIALNWIGESSSLTGIDAIAFPGLGAENRNPNNRHWKKEKSEIDGFYANLSRVLENLPDNVETTGKFLAPNEKLSIPELVKRLVTRYDIAKGIGMSPLDETFSDIYRKPEEKHQVGEGRYTGWFMGDGDRVGEYLKKLAQEGGDERIQKFSQAMRSWGEKFEKEFRKDLGRVVYAGGDDFLGVIYSNKNQPKVKPQQAFDWLKSLPEVWEKHKEDITLSVGFIWAGPSVPQRDILQHCREAEKRAKSLGRNRVTIRILFNSGQYVQWTCPWNYLNILNQYRDREGKSNWSHIYQDLAQLESRHSFEINKQKTNAEFACEFFDIYFNGYGKKLKDNQFAKNIVGFSDDDTLDEIAAAKIDWITDLIKVGWHLCSDT